MFEIWQYQFEEKFTNANNTIILATSASYYNTCFVQHALHVDINTKLVRGVRTGLGFYCCAIFSFLCFIFFVTKLSTCTSVWMLRYDMPKYGNLIGMESDWFPSYLYFQKSFLLRDYWKFKEMPSLYYFYSYSKSYTVL